MSGNNAQSPVDKLPPPEEVRRRLAENLREASILRSLLRLSQRAAKVRDMSVSLSSDADTDREDAS